MMEEGSQGRFQAVRSLGVDAAGEAQLGVAFRSGDAADRQGVDVGRRR